MGQLLSHELFSSMLIGISILYNVRELHVYMYIIHIHIPLKLKIILRCDMALLF